MDRIQFSDDQAGSVNLYTLSINPDKIDLQDNLLQSNTPSVDASPTFHRSYYDNRPNRLIWTGGWRLNGGPSKHSIFRSQLLELKGYIGQIKYINLNYIAIPTSKLSSGSHKIVVIDVTTSIRQGGVEKYASVELIFTLLEAQ